MPENKDDISNQDTGIINQEEIDSLVQEKPEAGIQAIVNSAAVSYDRLPMLDVIFDRLVRRLTTSLRNFTSDNVEVNMEEIKNARFGHHLSSISSNPILAIFAAKEWDNFGLLILDSDLVFSMVDVLLGGRKGSIADIGSDERGYTTIERSLIETLIDVVLRDLSKAFRPLSEINFLYERLETNPRFATIARPDNAVITVKMKIGMENRGGSIELLLPLATLEPVRELLLQRFLGEKFGRDSIWEGHLATELWSTEVEIDAVLDRKIMELGDVMNFEIGDTLMFNSTSDSDVYLNCGNIPLMFGKMGKVDKTVAIQISDILLKKIQDPTFSNNEIDNEINLDEETKEEVA